MGPASRPSLLPARLPPMLAVRAEEPFDSPDFSFEVKWDGFRCLAFLESATRLQSRRLRDLSGHYPELADLHLAVRGQPAVLDGEIVVFTSGAPDFGALLSRHQLAGAGRISAAAAALPTTYVAFDLLYWKGQNVMRYPLRQRQSILRETLEETGNLVLSRPVVGEGVRYAEAVFARGLEGVMAKRLDSPYLPGKRSAAWLKLKRPKTLYGVIAGYTDRVDGGVGSVVAGVWDAEGKLSLAGQAGVSLSRPVARELQARLEALRQEGCPFPVAPRTLTGEAHWVRPALVCRLEYLERPSPGHLRHAVFRELVDRDPAVASGEQLAGVHQGGEPVEPD